MGMSSDFSCRIRVMSFRRQTPHRELRKFARLLLQDFRLSHFLSERLISFHNLLPEIEQLDSLLRIERNQDAGVTMPE
jgi:hypothetical protein